MSDVFDDLAKAFKAGHDAGRSESADEIERLREDNDKLQRMLKMAATWTAEPGVTIAEIREAFSLLDRTALGEKE